MSQQNKYTLTSQKTFTDSTGKIAALLSGEAINCPLEMVVRCSNGQSIYLNAVCNLVADTSDMKELHGSVAVNLGELLAQLLTDNINKGDTESC